MLLITLLEAIGIQATEVLIQTRYAGQSALLRSEKVAIPLFDHGIAYLPAKDGAPAMWLDATSPQSRIGPLPSMDARTLAFFIDDGPPKMIETPLSSPRRSRHRSRLETRPPILRRRQTHGQRTTRRRRCIRLTHQFNRTRRSTPMGRTIPRRQMGIWCRSRK
jgi:hypothetical protein